MREALLHYLRCLSEHIAICNQLDPDSGLVVHARYRLDLAREALIKIMLDRRSR